MRDNDEKSFSCAEFIEEDMRAKLAPDDDDAMDDIIMASSPEP